MNREQLFTGDPGIAPSPSETHIDQAEFVRSPLEQYVVGKMPTDLRAISEGRMTREELAEKQAAILEEIGPTIAMNTDPNIAKITQLDLQFMFGGFIPAEQDMYRVAPPALMALIRQQCDRFPGLSPFMTYEMIVDDNSEEYRRTGVMRVYADGQDGLAERDFYLGHHVAEPYVKQAAYELHALAENPSFMDAEAVFRDAAANMDEFRRIMGSYSRLSKESFAYFRQYLGGYADGTRNASGAFMPSVQLMELALDEPTDMYEVYLEESQKYFPQWAQPVINNWRNSARGGVNIISRIENGQLQLSDNAQAELVKLMDQFINFRMAHLGITKAQIPGAFHDLSNLTRRDISAQSHEKQILEPEFKGTAGFDVRNVLTNSVYRLIEMRRNLTGNVGEEAA